MAFANKLYLGTSGWSYKSWEGVFYPSGTPANQYLSHYMTRFNVIEIDSTFYAIPQAQYVERWRESAPAGFLFCPKFPRVITHDKCLQDATSETALFLETMRLLGDHLGPVVLQFEYKFGPEYFATLERFLNELPKDLRFAVEIRNRKWLSDSFFNLLETHNVALVQSDLYYMPRTTKITADFTLIRLLGDRRKIPDEDFSALRVDRSAQLDYWADRITDYLKQGLRVFTFSNNRFEGHAPGTIDRLRERLGARGVSAPGPPIS